MCSLCLTTGPVKVVKGVVKYPYCPLKTGGRFSRQA